MIQKANPGSLFLKISFSKMAKLRYTSHEIIKSMNQLKFNFIGKLKKRMKLILHFEKLCL